MKRSAWILGAAIAVGGAVVFTKAGQGTARAKPGDELRPVIERASYTFGYNIGKQMRKQSLSVAAVDLGRFTAGLKAGLASEPSEVGDQAGREAIENLFKGLNRKFLDDNKSNEGVKVTASGLQYKVLKAGGGNSPKATDRVKVHYRGTLIDGREFDSSYKRGQPIGFDVGGVIKGWTEGLQLMKVGEKFRLFIPSDLAYGPGGEPRAGIGPNATLIFEVELLAIE